MNLGEYISQMDAPPASSGIPKTAPEDAAARGLGELAKAAMEYHQVFKTQADDIQRANDMAALDVSARKQVKDLESSLTQDSDWQTYEQRWSDGFSKIKGSLLDGVSDPKVKRTAVTHLGNLEADGIMRAAGTSRKMTVDTFDAYRLTSRKNALDSVATSTDPSDEEAAIGNHLGTIAAQEQGGLLAPDKAVKERQDFIQDVLVSRAKRDILTDPAAYFQKKKVGAYTGVDLPKMDLLDAAAVRQVEHNERVAEQQVKKTQAKNDAVILAGVDAGTVTDTQLDDAFLGTTRDPNFTPLISPAGYKEGKLKVAARSREGGPRNPAMVNTYKMEINLNPGRYSDKAITSLGEKGLNPADVLDILEYKRARVDDLQKLPPGASTGMDIIRTAVPRGFLNTMTDKIRVKLIADEQEYISRVRKAPEKWFEIASEISNRWKTIKNPQGTDMEDLEKLLNEAGK